MGTVGMETENNKQLNHGDVQAQVLFRLSLETSASHGPAAAARRQAGRQAGQRSAIVGMP